MEERSSQGFIAELAHVLPLSFDEFSKLVAKTAKTS